MVLLEPVYSAAVLRLSMPDCRSAPISESYLRELLRSTGFPFEQPNAGIRQHTFEEL